MFRLSEFKEATVGDHKKTTERRNYDCRIDTITTVESERLNGLALKLNTGINAIVGKNGIGKTTLLKSIHNHLCSEASNLFPIKMEDQIEVKLHLSDGITQADCKVFLYDPARITHSIQNELFAQDNIDEFLETLSEVHIQADELAIINKLLNSNINSITYYNIEDEFDGFPVVPYFKVVNNGVQYGSENMGAGEHSIIYLFWLFKYIQSNRPAIVLLEEPETFLPPVNQNSLIDFITISSAKFGVSVVITTHSEHILKSVNRKNIFGLKKVDNTLEKSDLKTPKFLESLGLKSPKRGFLICEDVAANELIRTLITESSIFVRDEFYFHISNGHTEITELLKKLPKKIESLLIVGVYDGDLNKDSNKREREKIPEEKNSIILKGNVSPEELLASQISHQVDKRLLAKILNTSIDNLDSLIDLCQGQEAHEALEQAIKFLEINKVAFYRAMSYFYASTNEGAVTDFEEQLAAILMSQ